ncbi:MAG: hypothetical protein D6720_11810 [Gammaproteobacteria bacterium]|nr:MAG: hypothetical protein D6720_11810 [Gammaproteobacteria bacterium]
MSLLYSIIESPAHPDFSALYRELGLQEVRLTSQRKAIAHLKKAPPDWVVAEFFYGYGNNYAGVNLSNLDVFLHSQRKYAPHARVIVLATPGEVAHVDKLAALFDLYAIERLPLARDRMRELLRP